MHSDNHDEPPGIRLPITTDAIFPVAQRRHEAPYGTPPIVFPAEHPIRFHLNAADLANTLTNLIAKARDDTTRRALHTAQRHMPTTRTAMSGGRLHLSNAHSGAIAVCTPTTCTCEAAARWNAPTCWHQQAAAAVRALFDSYQPHYCCPHCAGPMCFEQTPAGIPCFGCLICRHIRYPSTVAGLQTWPSAAASSVDEAA